MFDDSGRPDGYGQHSPFQDIQKAPGAVPQEKPENGFGGGTPSVPSDPTLSGWRTGTSQRRIGDPHIPRPTPPGLMSAIGGIPPADSGTGLQQAIGGRMGITDPGQGMQKQPSLGTGNVQADLMGFLGNSGVTGTYARTHTPELAQQFGSQYGYNVLPGNPNAKGTSDVLNINGRNIDYIHGGDDKFQYLDETGQPTSQPQSTPQGYSPTSPLLLAIMQSLRQGHQ